MPRLGFFLAILLLLEPGKTKAITFKALDFAKSQTDTIVWTPTKGHRIVLRKIIFTCSEVGNFTLKVNGSDLVLPTIYVIGGGNFCFGSDKENLWTGQEEQTLTITTTAPLSSIYLWGDEE